MTLPRHILLKLLLLMTAVISMTEATAQTETDVFYIRFTNRTEPSLGSFHVVTDNGVGNTLTMTIRGKNLNTTTDEAKNRLWQWVDGKYLCNLQGHYIYLDGTEFKTTDDATLATPFRIYYNYRARPKLRVLNADGTDQDLVMRADVVRTDNSPVVASESLTEIDDELELVDYYPKTGQKYFIRFVQSTFSRFIHEMGCPGMADTYNGHAPVLCISSGTTVGGDAVNGKSAVSYTPNMKALTWTLEQSGDNYRVKSDNGLYIGNTTSVTCFGSARNIYSIVSTTGDAADFFVRIRTNDHELTLTDTGHPNNAFNIPGTKQPRYVQTYASTIANGEVLDFVRNDDPLPQDIPTMIDGQFYYLYFGGNVQVLTKVHVDANGNYSFEPTDGQYVHWNGTGYDNTEVADEAAKFEVRAERTGWHLERVSNDINVKVTVANGGVFSDVYHYRNANNDAQADTWFQAELFSIGFEEGAKYVFYFKNNTTYGMYDSEMEHGGDCLLVYRTGNFGSMAWMAVDFEEHDGVTYCRFMNEFERYIAWDATQNKYIVTNDATKAALFTQVMGINGVMLQRLGSTGYFYPQSSYFYDKTPANDDERATACIYFKKVTSDDAWFDDATADYEVLHRTSYFQERANALADAGERFTSEFLQPDRSDHSGMTAKVVDGETIYTQNTPTYKLTRYVKQGDWVALWFSTTNGEAASLHKAYQRWYLYDSEKPLTHKYYLPYKNSDAFVYKNGLVMGDGLYNSDRVNISKTGMYVSNSLVARLPTDETSVTIACDFSYDNSNNNYKRSDMLLEYPRATSMAAGGNLTEPTLSLRQMWTLIDAKVMADEVVTKTGDNWLEERTIHFSNKTQGIVKEYIPLRYELAEYWFYKKYEGDASQCIDANLVSMGQVDGNQYNNYYQIELEDPDNTGITVDSPILAVPRPTNNSPFAINTVYTRRRLLSFSYPSSRQVPAGSKVIIKVYAYDNPSKGGNGNKYNVAKFTLEFDGNTETVPYMDVVGDDAAYAWRSPEYLRGVCGAPKAFLNFDYNHDYKFTSPNNTTFEEAMMAPLPLDYTKTSYAFARRPTNTRIAAGWGSSAVGNTHTAPTDNHPTDIPHNGTYIIKSVSEYTGIMFSETYDPGFLFVDASDMPGDVASVSFSGDFCEGSKLMCSGWMTSLQGGYGVTSSGSVILTVVGRKYDVANPQLYTESEIYSFCPGQLTYQARRANGDLLFPDEHKKFSTNGDYIWQQFYFEFYGNGSDEYFLRIENNATGTQGGDYMLDDVWVFSILPTIEAGSVLPLCGGSIEAIRLDNDFESLLNSLSIKEWEEGEQEMINYIGLVYIDWDKFLVDMKAAVEEIDGISYTYDDFITRLDEGLLSEGRYQEAYQTIFNACIMKVGDSNKPAYMNYEWSNKFNSSVYHKPYDFVRFYTNAEHDPTTVYYYTENDRRKLIVNGSMDITTFEYYHNYRLLAAILPEKLTDAHIDRFHNYFNVLSTCSKRSSLFLEPYIEVAGIGGRQDLYENDYCENTIQTLALHLTGLRLNTETQQMEVDTLNNVFFDWWIGTKDISGKVSNFNAQGYENDTVSFTLQHALKCLRYNFPTASSLNDVSAPSVNPAYPEYELTQTMIDYLRQLAEPADGSQPQLFLYCRVVNMLLDRDHAKLEEEIGGNYAYICAMPIYTNVDEGQGGNYYFSCSEPQSLKVKVKEVAPSIDIGFPSKHYPESLGLLSVRIAKKQFEQVNERTAGHTQLHIPIRNVKVESEGAIGIKIQETRDNGDGTFNGNVILLTTTDDSDMEYYLFNDYEFLDGVPVGIITYLNGTPNGEDSPSEALVCYFKDNFKVREGYSYTLKFPFTERIEGNQQSTQCDGYSAFVIRIVPDYEVWTGAAGNTDWSNDENWRRADYDELFAANGTTLKDSYLWNGHVKSDGTIDEPASNPDGSPKVNYITAVDRQKRRGFAPLYCTNILMMTDETAPAPVLYDDGDEEIDGEKTGFPALRNTSSPLIRYDFQGHRWPYEGNNENATDPYSGTNIRQEGDIITELYTSNVCDGIVFQPETELLHAEWLNYEKAWVEFALKKNIWHLVGSPLKNTISGEWYSPTWSARQETTYYEPVQFDYKPVSSIKHYNAQGALVNAETYNLGYDRFAPAVYQRAWDKAKAVLYERGAVWSASDGEQTNTNTGDEGMGVWTEQGNGFEWQEDLNASKYLNRLAYKPMGDSKVNVAIRGGWSGAYNDHTVPYDGGGFSVMPINHFKDPHNGDSIKTVFRLPKEDQYYDIWDWGKSYSLERRVRVYIKDENNPWPTDASWRDSITAANTVELNYRGRLRSDDLRLDAPTTEVPEPQPKEYTVTLKNEGQGSVGFFLACNPFICGLDMQKFFATNTNLAPYYLVLKNSDIGIDEDLTPTGWKWTDVMVNGNSGSDSFSGLQVVPARRGFFVRAADGGDLNETTVTFTTDMMVVGRANVPEPSGSGSDPSRQYLSISAQRDGNVSEARVIVSPEASNTFRPEEDLETFLVSDISSAIPVVYTLTGQLATSINRLRHFNVLPLGIISNSTDPAILSFNGVESIGSDLQLYDAYLQTFTPLKSGTSVRVPGSTQDRYYLVTSIEEETVAVSDIKIAPVPGGVHVTSVTTDPLTQVFAYDISGRRVAHASLDRTECSLNLPKGAYTIKAETANRQEVKKVMVTQ